MLLRQGDVLLVAIDTAPAKAEPVKRSKRGLVLAEGEATGHAHVITAESAQLVTADEAAELYLLVHGTEAVALTHEEHATIDVPPGTYRVVRQREYAPDAIRRVAD